MTPFREAFVLPLLFLTVVLLGGLRVGADVRLVPPPLVSLVLGMLLIGALVRAHVIIPDRLMSQRRTPVENVTGLVLLLTLFAASAQTLSLVTPDSGLLHLLVSVFFFVQLLTTLTAVRDRLSMLRSLAVLLGCAFVLRFVALEALYSPGRGLLKRLMTTALEGVTLGSLDYVPVGPTTGYIAFAALLLYMLGLVLLGYPTIERSGALVADGGRHPSERGQPGIEVGSDPGLTPVDAEPVQNRTGVRPPPFWSPKYGPNSQRRAGGVRPRSDPSLVRGLRFGLMALSLLAATTLTSGCSAPKASEPSGADTGLTTAAMRERILTSARVWHPPATPISAARLNENPSAPGQLQLGDEISCRFVPEPVHGTTPKFDCELATGEVVKIKYGSRNAEVFAEVAATRLLAALGFATDHMFVVDKVICRGCPPQPFIALRCHALTGWRGCFVDALDENRSVEFESAVIERPLDGRKIESFEDQGWTWYELDRIEAGQGGATRAELDALRLMAMILAHWDNKGPNQRLMCLPGNDLVDGSCLRAIALIHDLGATFGPTKVDLENWRRVPVWSDADACRISMRSLPYAGATFTDVQISEEGRTFVLELLDQLSDAQLQELFDGSRITTFDAVAADSRSSKAWARAFKEKVRQVREAGPCVNARHLP